MKKAGQMNFLTPASIGHLMTFHMRMVNSYVKSDEMTHNQRLHHQTLLDFRLKKRLYKLGAFLLFV